MPYSLPWNLRPKSWNYKDASPTLTDLLVGQTAEAIEGK